MVIADADAQATSDARPKRSLVLVVDDSPDMRYLLGEVLGAAGYDVVELPSAARALTFMLERVPDLVITDLLMPGMSGFSLRTAMLKRPALAEVPVVILSGYWQRPSETLDASAVLTKPLNIDDLLASVARLLRRT